MSKATPAAEQSNREQSDTGRPDEQDSATSAPSQMEISLQRVDALDHYEALVLLQRSEFTTDDVAPEGLVPRVERLIDAMDAAESLCGLVEEESIAVTVALTGAEAATITLAHAVAAVYYRSEGCPETAVVYERAAASLLRKIFALVEDA